MLNPTLHHIHRRADGSIDTEHYKRYAKAIRSREIVTFRQAIGRALKAVGGPVSRLRDALSDPSGKTTGRVI